MAKGTREGVPPLIIFEGEVHSPDDIFISEKQDLLLKINGGAYQRPDQLAVIIFGVQYPVPKGRQELIYIPSEIRAKNI